MTGIETPSNPSRMPVRTGDTSIWRRLRGGLRYGLRAPRRVATQSQNVELSRSGRYPQATMTQTVPEPFRTALRECFRDSCWASSWDSWEGFLHDFVNHLPSDDDRRLLRQQWADALVKRTLMADQFRELSRSWRVDAGDEEGLHDWLETCWRIFHHDKVDPADCASS